MKEQTIEILEKVREACSEMVKQYSLALETATGNPAEFTKEEVGTITERRNEAISRYAIAADCTKWVESV